ncbi:MAG: hypothetical protein AAGF01_31990 [Cyanobacteria bacterium P01_G01_bin.38]
MKFRMVSGVSAFLSAMLLASVGEAAISAEPVEPHALTNQIKQAQAQTKQARTPLTTSIRQEETLYLDPDASHDYNLRLDQAVAVSGLNLPVGSILRGSFEPIDGGLQYVANSVEIADRIYELNAASDTLHDRKDPRETRTGAILTDAAIGAAGGAVVGEVLGDIDVFEVLGGAAAGVIVGNTTAPAVVVIEPDEPILLYAQ